MEGYAGVPGLVYRGDFVDAAEERALLAAVDAAPWDATLQRRTQQYGARYDYGKGSERLLPAPPLPPWAVGLGARLVDAGLIPEAPQQLIVNEYLPGRGIARHTDGGVFGSHIASVSLGSDAVMVFCDRYRDPTRRVPVLLARRSVAVLAGPARRPWTHEIPPRRTDAIDGRTIARDRRVSLTFRTVL